MNSACAGTSGAAHVGRGQRHAVALEPVDAGQAHAGDAAGPRAQREHHRVGPERPAVDHYAARGAVAHRHRLYRAG
jgi:hypothetical protein